MKTTLAMAAVFAAVFTFEAAAKPLFRPYAVSKRVISIGQKDQLQLVKNGQVNFEIVQPVNPAAARAASELAARLSTLTGKKISPVKKASGKVPAFYLGICPESKAAGIDPAKLDRDGFYIKTIGNRIFITGVDTQASQMQQWATLFGVYDFLERFAGVRYYFPGKYGTIVPKKKNWSIPSIDIAERPDTQFRWIWTHPSNRGGGRAAYAYPGMKESNPKIWRNSSLNSVRACHGLNDLELAKRFRDTHPEFFAMTADGRRRDGRDNAMSYHKHGHLCYSSKGLLEEVCKDAEAALTGKPASSRGISKWSSRWNTFHVNPSPNDGMLWCLCPQCKKYKTKQEKTDHIWRFFVNIAQYLKEKKIEGMVIVNSYGVFSGEPQMELPDNINLGVAVSGPWSVKDKKRLEEGNKRISYWRKKLGHKVSTWTYPTKAVAAVPHIPNYTPKAMAEFYHPHRDNIYGGFVESGTDVWLFGFMNHYVAGKVLWNFDTDVNQLLKEHYQLMYGKGAPFMAKFFDEIERLWLIEIIGHKTYDTAWGEERILPTRREIWTKIYSPAKIAELEKLLVQAEKAAAKDKEAAARLRFMRANFWKPVLEGAEIFANEHNNRSAWTIYADPAAKITLDGKLDEEAWKKAEAVNLTASQRKKGKTVEVQTTVKALYDKEYFYFGFEAEEPRTDKIQALLTRGTDSAEIWRDSGIEIFLSAEAGSNFIYQYMVNAAGAKCDLRNMTVGVDVRFNSGFEAKCSVVPGKKYFVEVRIPRKAMPELAGRRKLMANFTRTRTLAGEKVKTQSYVWYQKDRNIAENCGILALDRKDAPKNLIKAGDFDKALIRNRYMLLKGWAGTKAIRLDKTTFVTKGVSVCLDKENNFLVQNIPVKPGKKYRLSLFVKTENASPGLRGLLRFGGAPAPAIWLLGTYKDYIRGTSDWYRVEKVFTAPKVFGKKHSPWFQLSVGKNAKGKCWVDHVELVELP